MGKTWIRYGLDMGKILARCDIDMWKIMLKVSASSDYIDWLKPILKLRENQLPNPNPQPTWGITFCWPNHV